LLDSLLQEISQYRIKLQNENSENIGVL